MDITTILRNLIRVWGTLVMESMWEILNLSNEKIWMKNLEKLGTSYKYECVFVYIWLFTWYALRLKKLNHLNL